MNRVTRCFALLLCFPLVLPALLGGCGGDEAERAQIVSPDGESVVTIKRSGDELYLEKDGRRVPGRYENILDAMVTKNGELVFTAQRDGKMRVMRGDEQIGEYEFVAGLTASPTGEVAYIAREGDKWRIKRDGNPEGEGYDNVSRPVYSPDGKSLVYTVTEGDRTFLVRDGVRQPVGYEGAAAPQFSPDGESVFLVVQVGEEQQALVKDGERITPPLDGFIEDWTTSPDGETTVVINRHDRKAEEYILKNGQVIGGPFDEIGRQPAFGPDGSVFFCGLVDTERGWAIYRDDQRFTDYIEARTLVNLLVSPDGRSVACLASREGRWYVLKDGQVVSDGFDRIRDLRTGPDGRTMIFTGVLDGAETEEEIEW